MANYWTKITTPQQVSTFASMDHERLEILHDQLVAEISTRKHAEHTNIVQTLTRPALGLLASLTQTPNRLAALILFAGSHSAAEQKYQNFKDRMIELVRPDLAVYPISALTVDNPFVLNNKVTSTPTINTTNSAAVEQHNHKRSFYDACKAMSEFS